MDFNSVKPGLFSPGSRLNKGMDYVLNLVEARRFCRNTQPAGNVRRRNPGMDCFKGPGFGPGMVDLDYSSGPPQP